MSNSTIATGVLSGVPYEKSGRRKPVRGQYYSQQPSLFGQLAGAATSAAGVYVAGGGKWSDRRLKRDIRRVGTLENGLPIYRFNYVWSPRVHVGLMADEVIRVHPEAVSENADGYKFVNYALAVL